MVFNSLQPTPFPNRLTMRRIVSALLSVADSEYQSWGKRSTTIKTISLLSAESPILIELTDWLSAALGPCPDPTTPEAKPSENSEMAGTSPVSPLCSPDSLSASWTAQPVRSLVPRPYTPQETWLRAPHLRMQVEVEAIAAVSTSSSTRARLSRRHLFRMAD